jgi:AraC-like DNA-binding protein
MIVSTPAVDRDDTHLPDPGTFAAFTLHGRCQLDTGTYVPHEAFTGVHSRLRSHAHRDSHRVLLVAFTPVGAGAFANAPLEEFADHTVELSVAFGRGDDFERLRDDLASSHAPENAITRVEQFLLGRMRTAPRADSLVSAAVEWLSREECADARIGSLADYIGLSQSALERRFRKVVGVSPKRFQKILRLQRIVRLHRGGVDFTTAAHIAGYYDQAHFIDEFRRVTGSSPGQFFSAVQ